MKLELDNFYYFSTYMYCFIKEIDLKSDETQHRRNLK